MDNTGNSVGNNSNSSITGRQSGASTSSIPGGEVVTSSVSQPGAPSTSSPSSGASTGEGESTESSSSKPLFKRPITRNMTDYDSDTDSIQTWVITRARRINKQN
jgi:hypothetical protein